MKIISIANQKGGVGKSTHAIHLAHALVDSGYRVLFVDTDVQGNSSGHFEENKSDIPASTLFDNECDGTGIKPVYAKNLGLIYADSRLANVAGYPSTSLQHMYENLHGFDEHYHFCVIDTPPSAGFILKSVVFASDYNFLPMELKQWSIDGTLKMLQTIFGMAEQKKQAMQKTIEFLGICINMYDRTDKNQPLALKELENKVGKYLMLARQQGEADKAAEIIGTIKISSKNVIEHSLNLKVPVWKFNDAQAEIKSKAAVESTKEFSFMYEHIFSKIGAEFQGLFLKKEQGDS